MEHRRGPAANARDQAFGPRGAEFHEHSDEAPDQGEEHGEPAPQRPCLEHRSCRPLDEIENGRVAHLIESSVLDLALERGVEFQLPVDATLELALLEREVRAVLKDAILA